MLTHLSPHKRHTLPQLRPLAPKLPFHPELSMQRRSQLEHNSIRDRDPTIHTDNFKLQHPAASQSDVYLKSVASCHNFTSPFLSQPDRTFSSVEWDSSRVPFTSIDDGFPELVSGNLVSGVFTHGSLVSEPLCLGLPTHHLPDSNLQFPETIQKRHGGDYCIPIFDALKDTVLTAQPTIGVLQSQCSTRFLTQYPSDDDSI